jgi:hypothetical protein
VWRIVVVGLVAVAATGIWWLAEDGDLRRHIAELGRQVLDGASGEPPPSWGDVAEKVGEFANEERGLKRTIGGHQVAPGPDAAPGPPD